MKKRIIAIAAVCTIFAAAGCNNSAAPASTTAADTTTTTAAETTAAPETTETPETTEADTAATEETEAGNDEAETADVMSYEDYIAAAVDDPVTIETYVQAKQGWWEDNGVGQASFYAQNNPEGGYFFYNMPCTKEEYDQIVPGTKLRVSGYKAEWSGEVEIVDSTFEIIDGDTFIASAEDVTDLLANEEELIKHQNELVSFKGMTVEAAGENGEAFLYKWDNSGSDGDDLYFNVSKDGTTYTFTVESYLCDNTTKVYSDIKELAVGDVVDLDGFLYWYNGANPHIISVTKA